VQLPALYCYLGVGERYAKMTSFSFYCLLHHKKSFGIRICKMLLKKKENNKEKKKYKYHSPGFIRRLFH
jgi:hypothetical protein